MYIAANLLLLYYSVDTTLCLGYNSYLPVSSFSYNYGVISFGPQITCFFCKHCIKIAHLLIIIASSIFSDREGDPFTAIVGKKNWNRRI